MTDLREKIARAIAEAHGYNAKAWELWLPEADAVIAVLRDQEPVPIPASVPELRLYYELLYAVESKFPGETRHETALRYIRDADKGGCEVAQEAPKLEEQA